MSRCAECDTDVEITLCGLCGPCVLKHVDRSSGEYHAGFNEALKQSAGMAQATLQAEEIAHTVRDEVVAAICSLLPPPTPERRDCRDCGPQCSVNGRCGCLCHITSVLVRDDGSIDVGWSGRLPGAVEVVEEITIDFAAGTPADSFSLAGELPEQWPKNYGTCSRCHRSKWPDADEVCCICRRTDQPVTVREWVDGAWTGSSSDLAYRIPHGELWTRIEEVQPPEAVEVICKADHQQSKRKWIGGEWFGDYKQPQLIVGMPITHWRPAPIELQVYWGKTEIICSEGEVLVDTDPPIACPHCEQPNTIPGIERSAREVGAGGTLSFDCNKCAQQVWVVRQADKLIGVKREERVYD